jgi:hypothetical protein
MFIKTINFIKNFVAYFFCEIGHNTITFVD